MTRRSLDELTNVAEPAWPLVQEWLGEATNPAEVLPVDRSTRGEALHRLQVTTRSPMGAIVYETGGLLVDDGWLRILGSGHPRLSRSIAMWNADKWDGVEPPPALGRMAGEAVTV